MSKADIGLIGLAVMGENLVMNMESKGYTVAVYNRTYEKVTRFVEGRAKNKNIIAANSLESLAKKLKKPRKVMIMVKSGKPVDMIIDNLIKVLDKGDIIIDGGNSYFLDTIRRTNKVEDSGLLYVGAGVSGGEEGALTGPSIMPGGSKKAWSYIKDIMQDISAKVENNVPCCNWVGSDGAGHFVKMVHNGIEYGDMQLISEAYNIMKNMLNMNYDDMHKVFKDWNKQELDSYLIEITAEILAYKDEDGEPILEKILDTAGQKGTGKWAAIESLDKGIPLTLISEAVYARCISAFKNQRIKASKILKGPNSLYKGNKEEMINHIKNALYASKLVSYAQGFSLMKEAAKEYNWDLNYGEIALMWRGGCIIRSAFLNKIKEAYKKEPKLENMLLDGFFSETMNNTNVSLRQVVSKAALAGVPVPALSSALSYYDSFRSERLPANLLQAQRDFFGAHTYERIDRERGEFFHTNWTGKGGNTSASTYTV